ncbi:MAG TPA: hypothetical protein VFV99_01320 [Kofleriaceae bacterium]|nr:hypothetical protein [Kofleriaceae bacterium]
MSEALRLRDGDPLPKTSPFYDGERIRLVAARGETIAFQVVTRTFADSSLIIKANGVSVRRWATLALQAKRASTSMYGATLGTGWYRDRLEPTDSLDDEAIRLLETKGTLFELVVARDADVGMFTGNVIVDQKWIPLDLTIVDVTLPPIPPRVWAYYDPRELEWAKLGTGSIEAPSEQEKRCIAMFRDYGVVLSVDMTPAAYPARKELLGDFPYVPVRLPKNVSAVAADVRAWIDATKGTGKLPFAIPIDEPRTPDARAKVKELATVVRAAGGGPSTFLYAVTAEPHPDFADLVDLYITLKPRRTDTLPRWTYNGAPPRAGSMVLDTVSPGTRTWGWIGYRYNIPVWYVWDALYWNDRHNRKGAPLPGREFGVYDAISFDDGEDRGNLDGVLALPGDTTMPCRPTLRLAAIHRGMQDRQLIELAAQCKPDETDKLVAQMVPRALGDIPGRTVAGDGSPSWPTDDAAWESARQKLLEIAGRCVTPR